MKKACANCYQLGTLFKGIRKATNESKNRYCENKKKPTPIYPDLENSSQDIPCTSKENNSPCSEHILNEKFQSSQLILSRQQSSFDNFDFNVDLEPGSHHHQPHQRDQSHHHQVIHNHQTLNNY